MSNLSQISTRRFGSANEFAMTFIGGGAKDARAMLKFMGDKKPGGSPFQINFPLLTERNNTLGITPLNLISNKCGPSENDGNPHRCSCLDCQDSCPLLDDSAAERVQACSFNGYSCSSIGFVSGYIAAITVFIVMLMKSNQSFHQMRGGSSTMNEGEDDEIDPLLPRQHQQQYSSSSSSYAMAAAQATLRRLHAGVSRPSSIIVSPLNSAIQLGFHKLGLICARYAKITIIVYTAVTIFTSLGWIVYFKVEIDPVKLWVSPTSETAREKAYYDEHFDPFYRTQQLILSLPANDSTPPLLNREVLLKMFEIEKNVSSLRGENEMTHNALIKKSSSHFSSIVPVGDKDTTSNSTAATIGLTDLCIKPVKGECVVTSVTGFWQGNVDTFLRQGPKNWRDYLQECVAQPVSCLPRHMQPLKGNLIFGTSSTSNHNRTGTRERGLLPDVSGSSDDMEPLFEDTDALIVTWVLKNNRSEAWNEKYAEVWERALIDYFSSIEQETPLFTQLGVRISFSSEVNN
jgi:Niemann-Pick C1 protein